jgi:hypothetical protein
MNRTLSDRHIVSVIKPTLTNNASVNSGWLSMMDAARLFAIINVGATDITLDAKIQQATDSSGSNAKDITGAAITQYTATDDDKFASIDLEAAALDLANNFNYVRLSITVGNGSTGAYVSAVLIRTARHQPPTQAAAYKEKIVVAG